ncbi:MAG: EAL domain-containing protein [Gammaproteobacteria bacterium]|nr:EAL domain-containing protein [Gammaproteobacteria bacterium]
MGASDEQAESVNSTLRNVGIASHISRAADVAELGDLLEIREPELIYLVEPADAAAIRKVTKLCAKKAIGVPVIVAQKKVTEERIEEALEAGARDLVSLAKSSRFQSVARRELRSVRFERAMGAALRTADEYKEQLVSLVEASADALAYAQEGIVVNVNPAWLELFGYSEAHMLIGQPLMDLFSEDSQVSLKGALRACSEDRWEARPLKVNGICADGAIVKISLNLAGAEFDGDPCVRISLENRKDDQAMQNKLEQALRLDPFTSMYHRGEFLRALGASIKEPPKGGIRALAYIKPDSFSEIADAVGPLASDEILRQIAAFTRAAVQPKDIYGRLGGTMFAVLLSRGTEGDVEAWAENLKTAVATHVFEVGEHTISTTISVGMALHEHDKASASSLIIASQGAWKDANDAGGNRLHLAAPRDSTLKIKIDDRIWIDRIRQALVNDSFRLVNLPIASLEGGQQKMFDVLVRMVDDNGKEILPGEFLPPAIRNGLMQHVDRWIIAQVSMLSLQYEDAKFFVRLSETSVGDDSLLPWLGQQLEKSGAKAEQLVFQVTEKIAERNISHAKKLAREISDMGCQFAIEHLGSGHQPAQMLEHVRMRYVKIDGSLMQGITTSSTAQATVKTFIESARTKGITTIAERVEDANTMATLWQLGVDFVQGYYVSEPEVILED